ncbi:hypothetical protein RhiirA5_398975 [Rhizophagus irregularis]|uniref:DUF7431 domain-containing protein n=4 Tax=Rhizophagus irregularis TaxID=588596 RepID=A0A2N0PQB3_9GLOM|nr:hypothetical protein RirG_216850 [Rhizophagus irregularis DAOM 197198w]PKC09005.1 hypothetical protein RhiirA5_398975 [Rhizophagus irregularis]GBC35178.1 hypothetical protein GLOIN_2v1711816 [Rhizophagus irregularis DAOM 181602=DAOM 197198]PKC59032.1 hypothetical protein RhiirA1_445578 [Rhizophagus irregularis]UZO29588.1 hypothetical protein OCT59_023052 [Rhizophagus irregularis]
MATIKLNPNKVKSKVLVHYSSEGKYLFKLRLDDNLKEIRKELAKSSKSFKMNEKLFEDKKGIIILEEEEDQFELNGIAKKSDGSNQFEIYLIQNEVDVFVHLSSENSYSFKLKLDDKLTKIRKEVAKKSVIKMDEKLFEDKENDITILEEVEYQFYLKDIVKKRNDSKENKFEIYLKSKPSNFSQNEEKLNVSVHLTPEDKILFNDLRLDDKLTKIREKLTEVSEIKMDEKLFHNEKKGTITLQKEDNFKLKDIVSKNENSENSYVLILKENLWKILNKRNKLDYGINKILKRVNVRAFVMKDCHVSEPNVKYLYVKNESKDDQTVGKDLSFNVDPSSIVSTIPISFRIAGNKSDGIETNSSDETTYNYKKTLEFRKFLEPTKDFIEVVKSAVDTINPKNSKKLKEIIEDFGQVIPTEIIMGEKIYKKGDGKTTNLSKGYSGDINATVVGMGISLNDSKNSTSQHTEESHQDWECIEYNNCINIFQLLTDIPKYEYLREKIFSVIGERILYSGIETCNCTFNGKKPFIGEFKMEKMSENTLKMIRDEKSDISIFAVIFDKKNYGFFDTTVDFFNCQIVCAQGQKPKYIIHRKQARPKLYECNLEIEYMIVGNYRDFNSINYNELDSDIQLKVTKEDYYSNFNTKLFERSPSDHFIGVPVLNDLNQRNYIIGHYFYTKKDSNVGVFTFSYNLEQNKYVNLPFRFHTLKISNISNQVTEFNYCKDKQEFREQIQKCPKYFNLYSKDISSPIFLKYTTSKIKLEEVTCKCGKKCDFCKNSSNSSSFQKENFDFFYLDLSKF